MTKLELAEPAVRASILTASGVVLHGPETVPQHPATWPGEAKVPWKLRENPSLRCAEAFRISIRGSFPNSNSPPEVILRRLS